jgi:UDP-glucose 4-epimerase
MVRLLAEQGFETVVFDDLSTGHREAVGDCELVQGDIGDPGALDHVLGGRRFDAVMHFCARSLVGESMREPVAYYRNNVAGTVVLLDAMQRHEVPKLVFSSTAAVFGEPVTECIDETHPLRPVNPYGRSKRMVEQMLDDAARAHGLRAVSLRYFNAAGASTAGGIGESHEPETHLIPNILKSAAGDGAPLKVFGDDYPTRDGTCIRDYIHVDDLARAHLAALSFMDREAGHHVFNLGNGNGFSVLEIIGAAERVTGQPVPYRVAGRREGDPAVLVASSARAQRKLGWTPQIPAIDDIVASAWHWHRNQAY